MVGGAVTQSSIAGVRCPSGGGSIHAESFNSTNNGVDFLMEAGTVMYIGSGRSESAHSLIMENGIVTLNSVTGGSSTVDFVEINGGICIMEGCDCHPLGQVIGTGGELYIAGCYFAPSVTPLSGYSGTVVWNPGGL